MKCGFSTRSRVNLLLRYSDPQALKHFPEVLTKFIKIIIVVQRRYELLKLYPSLQNFVGGRNSDVGMDEYRVIRAIRVIRVIRVILNHDEDMDGLFMFLLFCFFVV